LLSFESHLWSKFNDWKELIFLVLIIDGYTTMTCALICYYLKNNMNNYTYLTRLFFVLVLFLSRSRFWEIFQFIDYNWWDATHPDSIDHISCSSHRKDYLLVLLDLYNYLKLFLKFFRFYVTSAVSYDRSLTIVDKTSLKR
jgi:hypothetical protein